MLVGLGLTAGTVLVGASVGSGTVLVGASVGRTGPRCWDSTSRGQCW